MFFRRIPARAPILTSLALIAVCLSLSSCANLNRPAGSTLGPLPSSGSVSQTFDPTSDGETRPNVPQSQSGTTDSGKATTGMQTPVQSEETAPPTDQTTLHTQTAPQTTTSEPPTPPTPPTPPSTPETSDAHAKSELVRVQDYIPDLYVDLRYAGTNNKAGFSIYNYTDAYLRYGTVKKLAKVQQALAEQGLSLLIWDAFRPLDAQYALSVVLPDCGTSPVKSQTNFNYAGTVSLAIVNADGSALPIPSDFDEDGNKSDRDFSDLSAQAAKYGKLLDDLMTQNGFNRYLSKWYRYTDSDSYPLLSSTTLNRDGITDCDEWIVNCSNYVNLRSGPATSYSALQKIPKGKTVKVAFFHEKFAFVSYGGTTGYIHASYLRRPDEFSYEKELSEVTVVEKYTFEMMQEDLQNLAKAHPDLLRITSIGKSEEGRDLTLAILGNPDAKKKIFVSAGIHAREYMNCTLSMAQIDYMLTHPDARVGSGETTIRELLSKVCFHILPMSNPDGIRIAQTGEIPEMFKGEYSSSMAKLWKANAKGVDLNGNFDADWERYGGKEAPTVPGYMNYKGSAPECAAESKAIADYVRSTQFDLVLSYHCTGSVIYWKYGNNTAVNQLNRELAGRLAMTSGFTLGTPGPNSTAGLKDYVIDKLGIPALTIEFGTVECPMDLREFSNLWARNRDTLSTCALWVLER